MVTFLAAALLQSVSNSLLWAAKGQDWWPVPVITPDASAIPKGFKGDPPFVMAVNYFKRQVERGAFETSADYELRKQRALEAPLVGKLGRDDYFAFVVEHEPTYDADTEMATLRLQDCPGSDAATDRLLTDEETTRSVLKDGTTAFGVGAEYLSEDICRATVEVPGVAEIAPQASGIKREPGGFSISFKIPLDKAKMALYRLNVAIVGKLVPSDPVSLTEDHHGATLDRLYESTTFGVIIPVNPSAIFIWDSSSGEILSKTLFH